MKNYSRYRVITNTSTRIIVDLEDGEELLSRVSEACRNLGVKAEAVHFLGTLRY